MSPRVCRWAGAALLGAALLVPPAGASDPFVRYYGGSPQGHVVFHANARADPVYIGGFHFVTRCGTSWVPAKLRTGAGARFGYGSPGGHLVVTGELEVHGPGDAAGTVSVWRGACRSGVLRWKALAG